jgi:hypothetical protein
MRTLRAREMPRLLNCGLGWAGLGNFALVVGLWKEKKPSAGTSIGIMGNDSICRY